MSPDVYGAYRAAGIRVHGVWDWYLLQIDIWGWPTVLVWMVAACVAAWCGLGAALHAAGWMRGRRTVARDRAAAWRAMCSQPPTVQTAPGSDTDDLLACLQILDATDQQARKEKPQP